MVCDAEAAILQRLRFCASIWRRVTSVVVRASLSSPLIMAWACRGTSMAW